jgi:hypothetical protein
MSRPGPEQDNHSVTYGDALLVCLPVNDVRQDPRHPLPPGPPGRSAPVLVGLAPPSSGQGLPPPAIIGGATEIALEANCR